MQPMGQVVGRAPERLLPPPYRMLPLLGRAAVRCPAWLFVVAWARAATVLPGIASHTDIRGEVGVGRAGEGLTPRTMRTATEKSILLI